MTTPQTSMYQSTLYRRLRNQVTTSRKRQGVHSAPCFTPLTMLLQARGSATCVILLVLLSSLNLALSAETHNGGEVVEEEFSQGADQESHLIRTDLAENW